MKDEEANPTEELNESSSNVPTEKVKLFVGGIPPRTPREPLKLKIIDAFGISDEEIIQSSLMVIKLGYGNTYTLYGLSLLLEILII